MYSTPKRHIQVHVHMGPIRYGSGVMNFKVQ